MTMELEAIAAIAREVVGRAVGVLIDDVLLRRIEAELTSETGLPALCDRRCNPSSATKAGRVQAFVFLPDGEFVRAVLWPGSPGINVGPADAS